MPHDSHSQHEAGTKESRSLKTVHVLGQVATASGTLQELYLDSANNSLYPNLIFLSQDGEIYFETNELGLKGEAIDPRKDQAVVWGDSVVFSIGKGWPALLNGMVPQLQFLNGGIEGSAYYQILDRAVRLNREYQIALNIILLGWHTIGHNENVKSDLLAALAEIPNPVLVTMPTAFNPKMIEADISALLVSGVDPEQNFGFPGWPYDIETQQWVFHHIVERNRILREVAVLRQLPLVDLYEALSTEELSDIRKDFFDYMHPRPSAYPKIAQTIYEGLRPVLSFD